MPKTPQRPADGGHHRRPRPRWPAVEDARRPLLLPLPTLQRDAGLCNPRNNLAHCFHCNANLNNIDLMQMMGFDFPSAIELLEYWLNQYERRRPKSTAARPTTDRK